MHVHEGNWERALSIASEFLPTLIPEIHEKQAVVLGAAGNHLLAEELYLKAKRPEMAVDMYMVEK